MTRAGRKLTAALNEAISFAKGEDNGCRMLQIGPDGKLQDITDEWVKTRERHRGASAGTDTKDEAGDPKGAQGAPEAV